MPLIINNQRFETEHMRTPEEIETGMMGRNHLDGCMVFNMGKNGHYSFWMKNCLIPLDIIFINKGRITKIHLNCPIEPKNKLNLHSYTGIGDTIVEFPANTCKDWKIGDRVHIY